MSPTTLLRVNRFSPALLAAFMLAAVVLAALACAPALAKDDKDKDKDKDWKVLGQAKVEQRAEGDEIEVGADEGVFKRIKIEAKGADIEIKKITVVYSNDEKEDLEVRDKIKRGEQTRPIDLKGKNRSIKKVLFLYKTVKDADRDAAVILLGHK